jgi:hypothetical protein
MNHSRHKNILAVLAALLWGLSAHADTLEHVGTFEWPGDEIVGLSGLELSDDGIKFTTIGDRGWFLTGEFERDQGQIIGVTLDRYLPILGQTGRPVSARRLGDWSDAEGLALAPDGTYWISFERWARVARYASPDDAAHWIKDHFSFALFGDNRQLEALAIHPDGTLYTFPEHPLRDGFPIYRLDDEDWFVSGPIPAKNSFSIVGADFDRDGQLYILERRLVMGLWWQSRIRRLSVDAPTNYEILWTSDRGDFYNLEGIAVWHDKTGLRLTVVSDNNGDPNEPTQFVDFRLIEAE